MSDDDTRREVDEALDAFIEKIEAHKVLIRESFQAGDRRDAKFTGLLCGIIAGVLALALAWSYVRWVAIVPGVAAFLVASWAVYRNHLAALKREGPWWLDGEGTQ